MQTVAFAGYVKRARIRARHAGAGGAARRSSASPAAASRRRRCRRPSAREYAAPAGRARAALAAARTSRDFVDHIDHAVKLIGIDHVGISSDFDGGGGVSGWNDATETFNVTLELVRRGYTEEQIEKLWGGNLLRVWRAAERGRG